MAQVPMSPDIIGTCPTPNWIPVEDDRTDLMAIHDNVFDGERIDGVFRGCETGVRILAVTNRRLMMVEATTWEGRVALTSVPFARVTSVGFLTSADAGAGDTVATSTAVGVRVLGMVYELGCQTEEQAREVHDLITWNLIHE